MFLRVHPRLLLVLGCLLARGVSWGAGTASGAEVSLHPQTNAPDDLHAPHAATALPDETRAVVSLEGTWRFRLDTADVGQRDGWFQQNLTETIRLPGTLQEQGFGPPPSLESQWAINETSWKTFTSDPSYAPYRTPENFKSPFWLTPKRHYVGPAWYQRDLDVPEGWTGRRVVLHLERPHWQTTVWLDGHELGSIASLDTPHDYDLSVGATPGRHRLTIRVDNRLTIPVGPHSHGVTDFSQTNWNGIIGAIELQAGSKLWLDAVELYPNVARRSVRVVAALGNLTAQLGNGALVTTITGTAGAAAGCQFPPQTRPVSWDANGGRLEFEIPLGRDAELWDEFSPALYQAKVQLKTADGATCDVRQVTFGLREIKTAGRHIVLNGRTLQLRGTLECCIFPLTGYPPTDVAPWRRILQIARSYGLNHLRFHTWCPPEAAFVAADELGFYLQVETACWGRFGDGGPLDTWIAEEGRRMLRAYGNHPSFVLFAATNEPKGPRSADFLASVVEGWKALDDRHLYTAGSGANGVKTPASDYYVEYATRFHVGSEGGELTTPPQTASDYREFIGQQPEPCIAHELGQWCVYPDFSAIPKFTGALRPGHLEIFRETLARSGLLAQAPEFLHASGRLQVELYKAEIEEVLRTPDMAGYQLLDLHDFPGQGIAPVGVLDEFWDSKGYVTPEEYRRFTGPTVALARLSRRVFTTTESAAVAIEVSHFGPTDLAAATVAWRVVDTGGRVVRQGAFEPRTLRTGGLTACGTATLSFADWRAPEKYRLEVAVNGTAFHNDWDFWVYPATVDTAPRPGVTIATQFDDATRRILEQGGVVLLLPPPATVAGDTHSSFAPIFWNRILFPKQKNHTLGLVCDARHPVFAAFPTETHSNWQWWDLVEHAKPMVLNALPPALKPLVQPIDDWNIGRKLGLVLEARVGNGRLVLSSIDLVTDLEKRPVARQFRASLLGYMASPQFSPAVTLTSEQVASLLVPASSAPTAVRR